MESHVSATFPRLADEPISSERGIGWVLRQFVMGSVALTTAVLLLQLGCLLAAERALAFVAQDAVRLAQLPRVTSGEVHRQIDDRLRQLGWNDATSRVILTADGTPMAGFAAATAGQRFAATIAVPAELILPASLATVSRYVGLDEVVVQRSAVVR